MYARNELRRHHWQYDAALFVHRCAESHPFLIPEREAPCNGCGALVTDERLSAYRDLRYAELTMDMIVAGYFGACP